MPPDGQPDNSAGLVQRPARLEVVPAPAVRRLSLYLRELESLLGGGQETISSKDLGNALGYTDAQVRKDLAYFGQFGHPGIGYRVKELITRIRGILGTDRVWKALVVGAGNLGQALVSYRGFLKKGFEIVAVFDNDPKVVGRRIGGATGVEVLPPDRLADTVRERGVELGILAVPADVAQRVADQLVEAGIKGILNFAPTSITVPDTIPLGSVDLSVHLEQLAFRISTSSVTTPQ
ncbi:MAG: redox-sensing transcriptional repressor Rex [Planctomycetes bacterium]|nr:redox-sensing transcriptional repressor Rex [Planctomycetota bacterium]